MPRYLHHFPTPNCFGSASSATSCSAKCPISGRSRVPCSSSQAASTSRIANGSGGCSCWSRLSARPTPEKVKLYREGEAIQCRRKNSGLLRRCAFHRERVRATPSLPEDEKCYVRLTPAAPVNILPG